MPIPSSRPSTGPTAATLWNWKAIVARKTNSTASMVQRLCTGSPRLCDRAILAGCRARTHPVVGRQARHAPFCRPRARADILADSGRIRKSRPEGRLWTRTLLALKLVAGTGFEPVTFRL